MPFTRGYRCQGLSNNNSGRIARLANVTHSVSRQPNLMALLPQPNRGTCHPMKPKMKTKTKTKNLCYLIFSTYCISAVCSTSGAAPVAFNKYVQAARKPGANQAT